MHNGHDHSGGVNAHHDENKKERKFEIKELEILYVLLDHWIEHNIDHSEVYREWSEKAENNGKIETANEIKNAISHISQANDSLKNAKSKME